MCGSYSSSVGSGRLGGDEVGKFSVGKHSGRGSRFVQTREADDKLAGFEVVDGVADGVAEQREELIQLDGRKPLCSEELETVEILAYIARRLDHPKIQ